MKQKRKNPVLEQVKAARKQSREEEIQRHGKSINYRKVMESKKRYNRKKNKADDEVLPYFFVYYGRNRNSDLPITKYLLAFQQVQRAYYQL
jgi:hypothetical protein